jgi:hypothetical protein
MNIQGLIDWQKGAPRRYVNIKIEPTDLTIWVYDGHRMIGQFVSDASEIDLDAVQEAKDRAAYEKLKAKYEVAA